MGGELPGVRQLVEDEPAPEGLGRQLGLLLPIRDVGLDEVQTRGDRGLAAEELGIVLAEHAPAQEAEQDPHVLIHGRPAEPQEAGVGQPRLDGQDGLHGVRQDGDVEVDPGVAVERLEWWQRGAFWQAADGGQQRTLDLGGQAGVVVFQAPASARIEQVAGKAVLGPVADLVPVEQAGRTRERAEDVGDNEGHGAECHAGNDSLENAPAGWHERQPTRSVTQTLFRRLGA